MLDVFILNNVAGPHGETILALMPRRQKRNSPFHTMQYKGPQDTEAYVCTVRQAVLSQLMDACKSDRIKFRNPYWRLRADAALRNSSSNHGLASNKCSCSEMSLEALTFPLIFFLFLFCLLVRTSLFPINTSYLPMWHTGSCHHFHILTRSTVFKPVTLNIDRRWSLITAWW